MVERLKSESTQPNFENTRITQSSILNKMGTLFRDLRRQFVSFTWMSGVFYLQTIYIQVNSFKDLHFVFNLDIITETNNTFVKYR